MPTSTTKFIEEEILLMIERTAQAAVRARRAVVLNATNHLQCNEAATANAAVIGISLNAATAAGESVSIAISGITMALAGATIVINDELVTDANGALVPRGTTATTLYQIVGRALTAAAAGELVCVDLIRYTVWGSNAS